MQPSVSETGDDSEITSDVNSAVVVKNAKQEDFREQVNDSWLTHQSLNRLVIHPPTSGQRTTEDVE